MRRGGWRIMLATALLGAWVAAAAEGNVPRGLHVGSGLSLDRGAVQLAVGAQLPLGHRVWAGLDAELDPWFDLLSGTASRGAFNAWLTGGVVWTHAAALRVGSALKLGTSVLLFDVPGARRGAVGLFFAVAPLRLGVLLTPRLELELAPELALVAPSLKGVPFVYREYRATVGLRFGL